MEQAVFAAVGYSCPPWEDMILFSMDESGALRRLDGACLGCSPSFLCEDGQGGLFVGCENPADAAILHFPGSPAGSVREWRLPYRQLCHLMRHGNTLYASCYGDGAFFALDAASGREVWHACMQPGRSRAHWSAVSPDGAALFACDLGTDSVYCFRLLQAARAKSWQKGGACMSWGRMTAQSLFLKACRPVWPARRLGAWRPPAPGWRRAIIPA